MKSVGRCSSLVIVLWAIAASGTAAAGPAGPGFLTGPAAGAPLDIVVAYLNRKAPELGLTPADVQDFVVTDQYTSGHNGVTHLYLRQRYEGIEVVNANINANVAADGSIISLGSSFVPRLAEAIVGESASWDAADAVTAACWHLGHWVGQRPTVRENKGGAAAEQVLDEPEVSPDPIPAKLVYQPVAPGVVRLAWQVEINEIGGDHWWSMTVDAETGSVLDKHDYVVHDEWGTLEAEGAAQAAEAGSSTAGAGSPTGADAQALGLVEAYRVFSRPKDSPYDGDRTLEVAPADPAASPFGWHDTNGADGPEFTITRGNNVHAYTDLDANNVADPGSSPDGGAALQFDFPIDLSLDASTYRPATVTNLFYWNNTVHDVFHHYGFDEISGNFQVNNYGRGGLGNDDVRAEAQDGSGTNNANFGTPPDGARPRMQMFIWSTNAAPNAVTVNGGPLAGNYPATGAAFGPTLTTTGPITADLFLVNDGTGVSSTDGCEPFIDFPAGGIALVDRGDCNFVIKVAFAQAAGALGVVVANNVAGAPITMGGADPTITIPSVMVSQANGTILKGSDATLNVTLRLNPDRPPSRDSDLDAGVITHEYGHGISNRLTGGPATTACLGNAEQMGEGWSDWLALVITARPGDTAEKRRGIGNYVSFRAPDGNGIRPTAYTTDMAINPTTYSRIGSLSIPHGVGYAWASMLWEMYWNLVQKHGYNPDIFGPWTSGGNNLAIQLVLDGMKFQPCRPGFVDGRNAVVQADQVLTGGANQCLIWKGFAKRGLGFGASQGLNTSTADGVEAFDLVHACLAGIGVSPGHLTHSQIAGVSTAHTLSVSNASALDGTDLTWTVTEAPESCSAPGDVPWVSATPGGDTTVPGAAGSLSVTFDSTGLGIGARAAKLCLGSNDPDTPTVEVPLILMVIHDFAGFFPPVANPPALNSENAGQTVPLKFSLRGNKGVDVLAAGYPVSRPIDCATKAPVGPNAPTSSTAPFHYDAKADQYVYNWKTQKSWVGTCRQLTVRLNDGTDHRLDFSFR